MALEPRPAGPRSGTAVSADITAATRAIRVVPRSVNLLAEQGTLQVTVVNGLDYVVDDIRLKLVPNNPRIQIVEQPGPITHRARVAGHRAACRSRPSRPAGPRSTPT